ncbi:hypothetical protein H0H92_006633, partial [Tricholoma furcatifolium]
LPHEEIPADGRLAAPADQIIRPFDFEPLLKAAVEDEDLREEESMSLDVRPTPDRVNSSDVEAVHPSQVGSIEGLTTRINSHAKRPTGREEAWKVRKKANRKTRAMRDVYNMGGISCSKSIRVTSNARNMKLDNFDMETVKVAGPGYVMSWLLVFPWAVDGWFVPIMNSQAPLRNRSQVFLLARGS